MIHTQFCSIVMEWHQAQAEERYESATSLTIGENQSEKLASMSHNCS